MLYIPHFDVLVPLYIPPPPCFWWRYPNVPFPSCVIHAIPCTHHTCYTAQQTLHSFAVHCGIGRTTGTASSQVGRGGAGATCSSAKYRDSQTACWDDYQALMHTSVASIPHALAGHSLCCMAQWVSQAKSTISPQSNHSALLSEYTPSRRATLQQWVRKSINHFQPSNTTYLAQSGILQTVYAAYGWACSGSDD